MPYPRSPGAYERWVAFANGWLLINDPAFVSSEFMADLRELGSARAENAFTLSIMLVLFNDYVFSKVVLCDNFTWTATQWPFGEIPRRELLRQLPNIIFREGQM